MTLAGAPSGIEDFEQHPDQCRKTLRLPMATL
jgi:hypothetical protein